VTFWWEGGGHGRRERKENETDREKSLNTAGLPNQNKKDDRRDGERPHPETTDSFGDRVGQAPSHDRAADSLGPERYHGYRGQAAAPYIKQDPGCWLNDSRPVLKRAAWIL
jgi:hypothetical protein